jgi:hypothetical protein
MPNILISGIVAARDKMPYVQVDIDGRMVQLGMGEARSVALDLLRAAGYAEADAMIRRFFDKQDYPRGAADALMVEFREFRAELEKQRVDTFYEDQDA